MKLEAVDDWPHLWSLCMNQTDKIQHVNWWALEVLILYFVFSTSERTRQVFTLGPSLYAKLSLGSSSLFSKTWEFWEWVFFLTLIKRALNIFPKMFNWSFNLCLDCSNSESHWGHMWVKGQGVNWDGKGCQNDTVKSFSDTECVTLMSSWIS